VISLGSISNIERRVSRALAVPVGILHAMIQLARVVYADETTWKERAKKIYIWTAVTSFGAVYLLRPSRASAIAKELLGSQKKYVITDRYSGYSWIPLALRQICWAHLIRDFKWIMGFEGEAGRIGNELLKCARRLFGLWHRVRDGTMKRSSFRTLVSPIRQRIKALLEEGVALDLDGVSGMCKQMLKVYPAFYTFVRVEGVSPTNNAAERQQRHPAMWRRVSFGTWSRRGSEYVERILSTVATLRIQERDVLPYLRQACQAALDGKCAPFLVPLDREDASEAA
jgi:transposase